MGELIFEGWIFPPQGTLLYDVVVQSLFIHDSFLLAKSDEIVMWDTFQLGYHRISWFEMSYWSEQNAPDRPIYN